MQIFDEKIMCRVFASVYVFPCVVLLHSLCLYQLSQVGVIPASALRLNIHTPLRGWGSDGSHQVFSFPEPTKYSLIWQGFHFQWLRRTVGFETPHRLGSVTSYITTSSETETRDQTSKIIGVYNVQFSPGVDGDYAFPGVYYSGLGSPNLSQLLILSGNWSFSFSDNSSLHPVLHAETVVNLNASIVLDGYLNTSQSVEIILQGFRIEMQCLATSEHTCNSNAVWAYYFNLSLPEPCSITADRKIASCLLLFALGRGWTPTHGGGKPYNYQMVYNLMVFYKAFVYPNAVAQVHLQRLSQKSNIYNAPLSGYRNISNTSTAKHSAVFGLREFSWNLTGSYEDRGRYLEELQFAVQGLQSELQCPESELQCPESELQCLESELQYRWRVGYRAPAATTYASDVEYSLLVSALVLPREYMQVTPTLKANGTVCKDDKVLFHCATHGLREELSDNVTICSQL